MGKQFLMPLYSFWCSLSLCPSVLLSACVCACVCSYVFLCVPVCMCASVRVEMYGVRVQRRLQACASLFPFVLLLLASSSLSWVASRRHTASCCTLCASPSLMCRSPSPGLSMNDRTDRAAFSKPYGSLPNRVLCSYAFVSKLLPSLSLPLPPPPSLPLFFFPPLLLFYPSFAVVVVGLCFCCWACCSLRLFSGVFSVCFSSFALSQTQTRFSFPPCRRSPRRCVRSLVLPFLYFPRFLPRRFVPLETCGHTHAHATVE